MKSHLKLKFFCLLLFVFLILISCGPSAEELEKQRIQDSIQTEEDRLKSIGTADDFITGVSSGQEEQSDTLAENSNID